MNARRHRGRRAYRIRAVIPLSLIAATFTVCAAVSTADKPSTTEPGPTVELISAAEYTAEPLSVEATEPAPSRYAAVGIEDEDVYTLACLVYHEARGEPFEGQVAVAEVVLNRCISDEFPDTVSEVVFQRYGDVWQFSPAPYLWTAEPGEEQYKAVYEALDEQEYILTEETVYFSTSPYNDSISAVIGNHYFCEIGG